MNKKLSLLFAPVLLSCFSMTTIMKEKDTSAVSLYKSYQSYFPIGAAINPDTDLRSPERRKFIAQHFNSITAENQMKTKQIHPKENVWNWGPADAVVQFAKEHKMKVRGHTLVWQQNTPSWLIMEKGRLASKEYMYAKMKEHITTVMNRYKDNVYCWDVVNEAISDKGDEIFRAKDSLFAIAGEAYVEMAFRYSRQADPNAKLFYNDYRFSNPVKRKKIYDLLKALVAKGIPIDGVGIQSHYTPNEVTREYLQETIDMFAGLGLQVHVTELDVSVYNYRDKNSPDVKIEDDVYTEERKRQQEEMYKMLFDVYRKNRNVVTSVTFWGVTDARKNFRTNRIGKMDYPFLFDEQQQPKNVFYSITKF